MNQTTASAIAYLEEIKTLLELKGENRFKIRAFENAMEILKGYNDLKDRARKGTLVEIKGIGKGLSDVLVEYLVKEKTKSRDELAKSIPAGLVELVKVPGLGPKKAAQLTEELDIHSISELEYAIKENRLLNLKGFGEKIQAKLLEGIQFLNSTRGQSRLVEALALSETVSGQLRETLGSHVRLEETGALRRRMEVVDRLEFLIELPAKGGTSFRDRAATVVKKFERSAVGGLPVTLHFTTPDQFGFELARTTASEQHWTALGVTDSFPAKTEDEFYSRLSLEWISPELRETGEEVAFSKDGRLDNILPTNGVVGVFHNHTTRSDGLGTLEQMVQGAQEMGYEFIGISDHSQSAFYAQGLKPAALAAQAKEVKQVQEKYPDIRIFWGIESDILADGSLDYDDSVLKKFDFVIASVHSRFKMERQEMTDRILKAIRNPHTRFLGHVTGRLLLGRKGYDLDMEKIIRECSENNVAIELNANPARLDIDWRWGKTLRDANTWVAINPDAHSVEGLSDTRFGVSMARKALLPQAQVINARSLKDVEKWLARKL